MRITNKTSRRTRKTVRSCLFLSLSILEISSPSATANQSILFPARFELQSKQDAPISLQQTDSKEKVTFQLRRISDGILCPIDDRNCPNRDAWWKDFELLASDGHTLHLTSIPFPNVKRSKNHFRTSIKGAEKILRRDPESDSKGELVGERALGSFSAIKDMEPPSGVAHYRLFWTWGKNYLDLEGEHLEDVLALENR